ncbi:DNA glycosylase [Meira miltonrushii]|uniref:Endonuclease III homolog n=1 Tax=Meira miltonrushii TaxID=1280837 RepID=A0A316VBM0_9BASI|nr:DNA glycosylase [Meira miltonrushii]PWN34962.1 DNA glycosylase [Meira miltonrushii]
MTARTSSRSISSSAASTSKRTLANAQSEEASTSSVTSSTSAADEVNGPATAIRSKRTRYVPPAIGAEEAPVAVKVEQEESVIEPGPATPVRYSLRRRINGNGIANGATETESGEIKPLFKMEEGEEELGGSISTPKKKTAKVKKEPADPFAVSPRKTSVKPIKLDLEEHEIKPAPKRWKEQLEVLTKQRKRIIAPVDTLGCEENGRDEKRKDLREMMESPEESAKRARFTTLVSLMLSSQTKDPVTAEAVHNLQRNLPNGLCLDSILNATQDQISSNISKVGFWRRKTGYIQSAAKILRDDFEGDVPKTIDELCSLPGVGPKMGFLALQSAWNINVGIGVDVHVHRVSNRLKWVKSNDPEGTRLQLQSWLPKELHRTINKTLVGFGQVICQPVGPRCDLCALGAAKLCPSYRKVDPKSIASRVKVELLPEEEEVAAETNVDPTAAVKLEGPEGGGTLLIKEEDERLDW